MTTTPSDPDRDDTPPTGPLGSAKSSPHDVDSGGAPDVPASGAAGPTWPPAGTEPDAHGDDD